MIVESLGNVTFVNGLMRVQTLGVNPAGKMSETGTIEIPGNKIGEVINLLKHRCFKVFLIKLTQPIKMNLKPKRIKIHQRRKEIII